MSSRGGETSRSRTFVKVSSRSRLENIVSRQAVSNFTFVEQKITEIIWFWVRIWADKGHNRFRVVSGDLDPVFIALRRSPSDAPSNAGRTYGLIKSGTRRGEATKAGSSSPPSISKLISHSKQLNFFTLN